MSDLFNNPGAKIKKIAMICFWLSCIAGVIILLVGFKMYSEDKKYIEYLTAYNYPTLVAAAQNAVLGRAMMIWAIPGALASMLSAYILYGFGELIEKATLAKEKIEDIEKKIGLTPEAVEQQQIEAALKF